MPHRSSKYIDYCTECQEHANDACFRCGRPFCESHRPLNSLDERCTYCTEAFSAELKKIGCNELDLSEANISGILVYCVGDLVLACYTLFSFLFYIYFDHSLALLIMILISAGMTVMGFLGLSVQIKSYLNQKKYVKARNFFLAEHALPQLNETN